MPAGCDGWEGSEGALGCEGLEACEAGCDGSIGGGVPAVCAWRAIGIRQSEATEISGRVGRLFFN
jgi:hypothetical protein